MSAAHLQFFRIYPYLLSIIELAVSLRVSLEQLKNSRVLHSLGVKLRVICTFSCDRLDALIPKKLRNMKLALTDVFACNEKIISAKWISKLLEEPLTKTAFVNILTQ